MTYVSCKTEVWLKVSAVTVQVWWEAWLEDANSSVIVQSFSSVKTWYVRIFMILKWKKLEMRKTFFFFF